MPILSKASIEMIRNANDIADVVGSYLQLKRAGTALKALCPFHKEKSPSFHVNPQRQIFHCFGCGAGGDVFKFVMQYEGVEFVEAAQLLARRAGLQIQFEEGGEKAETGAKETLLKLHEDLTRFYQRVLLEHPDGAPARAYLKDRRLGPDLIEMFKIGFAPHRPDALRKWSEKSKYSIAQLEAAGVVARGERDPDDLYDRFRGRLMFPLRDELGRVIGFSGRIIEKDQHPAKYVNSPETLLFKKSRVLYALDLARRPILDARTALVCEGQIDVIRCHAAGLNTAVAGLGTALTEDHARLLKRYADSVILLLDADTAGQNSAIRTSEIFLAAGLAVRIATLPPGEDPDSLVLKSGADALRTVVAAAKSGLEFHADVLTSREDIRTAEGMMRVSRALLESIARAPTAVQRDQMLQQVARRLNVSENSLRADLAAQSRKAPRRAETEPPRPPPVAHPPEEVELARVLAHHPECAAIVRRFLPVEEISDPACRVIIARLLDGEANLSTAVATESEECGRLAAEILATDSKIMGADKSPSDATQDLILRVRRRVLETRRRAIEAQRNQADAASRDRLNAELAQLILDVRSLKDGWEKALPFLELHAAHPNP